MKKSPISVLLCDPPWFYNNRKTGGERQAIDKPLPLFGCKPDKAPKFGGGARKHYPLMHDEQLLALAPLVKSVMAENSALFMWATSPRKDFAIDLLKAWGFRYTTEAFVWIKLTQDGSRPNYGPGFYTASNAESVLLGVRGSMPPVKKMTPSVLQTPWLGHSVKPQIHRVISNLYPSGHKVEMFSRRPVKRWHCIGNGISGLDINQELEQLSRDINGVIGPQLALGL